MKLEERAVVKQRIARVTYACGHESEMKVLDCNPVSLAAYLRWSESVGREGSRLECWDCFCGDKKH